MHRKPRLPPMQFVSMRRANAGLTAVDVNVIGGLASEDKSLVDPYRHNFPQFYLDDHWILVWVLKSSWSHSL
jgi:hypothetical protein